MSVQATSLLRSARIFANVSTSSNTGVAIVNPQDTAVQIVFSLIDSQGQDGPQGFLILKPHEKVSKFASESPFFSDSEFEGTLTLSATQAIAVTAFEGLNNERGEFLMSDAGVLDLATASTIPPVLAHFANGGGWTTQILMVNPYDRALSGFLAFFDDTGVRMDFTLPYSLPPKAGVRIPIPTTFWGVTGSLVVSPDLNSSMPWALSRMAYKPFTITVNQVTLAAGLAPGYRAYVEAGPVESAVAVVNSSNFAAKVNLTLMTSDGIVVRTKTLDLSGRARLAQTLSAYFPDLPRPFSGVLHLTATNADGITVAIFRCRYNERGDFMATLTDPIPDQSAPTANLYFPHIVAGQGYTTELVLFNGEAAQFQGTLELYDQSGVGVPTLNVIRPVN
jgi:hypothetical protein